MLRSMTRDAVHKHTLPPISPSRASTPLAKGQTIQIQAYSRIAALMLAGSPLRSSYRASTSTRHIIC